MGIAFRHETLDNGLNIIAETNPDAHTAAVGVFVRTGARDEPTTEMGVSHFLEHMMFKGTERRTADDVNQQFDDIGANYNAFTSHEMTAFWAHVLPEYLDQAEDILTDILRPSLRKSDFDQEKGVILEEIAMYDDNPFWVLYEALGEHYYPAHPLRHRVLGTKASIVALGRDEMQSYFDQRYSADNTVVCLAGNLDFDAHVNALRERCGGWARTGAARTYPPFEPVEDDFTMTSEKVNRHYMLAASPAPSIQSDDRYAATILAEILGGSDGSRLYWALIDSGLAEESQAQYDGRDGLGEYYLYASCSVEDAPRVEEVIREQATTFVNTIRQDDLERVRSKIATSVTLAGERPSGRMQRLGALWTYTGSYRSLEEELSRIEAVTIADLQRVAGEYPLAPRVVGRLTPAK